MPPATPHVPNDFPRRLARLRVLLGLTWKGLARDAGLNIRTLHRWWDRGVMPLVRLPQSDSFSTISGAPDRSERSAAAHISFVRDEQGQIDASPRQLVASDVQKVIGGKFVLEHNQHVGDDAVVFERSSRGEVAQVRRESVAHGSWTVCATLVLEEERLPAIGT